jgi:hypothetical protein
VRRQLEGNETSVDSLIAALSDWTIAIVRRGPLATPDPKARNVAEGVAGSGAARG